MVAPRLQHDLQNILAVHQRTYFDSKKALNKLSSKLDNSMDARIAMVEKSDLSNGTVLASSSNSNGSVTNDPVITFFTGNLTVNPPTTSTANGTVSCTGEFSNGGFNLTATNSFTLSFQNDNFDVEKFTPVTVIITGALINPDDTIVTTVDLIVNQLNVIADANISNFAVDDGTFQIFTPSMVFQTGKNDIQFVVKTGSGIKATALSVVSATDLVDDTDQIMKLLSQMMARMGAENALVLEDFDKIIATCSNPKYKEIQSFTGQAQELKKSFQEMTAAMKQNAFNLQALLQYYVDFVGPEIEKDPISIDEVKSVFGDMKNQLVDWKAQSQKLQDSLIAYQSTLRSFSTAIGAAATQANLQIQADLANIEQKITTAEAELQSLQTKLSLAGAGLGISVTVGAIGIGVLAIGGPVGWIVGGLMIVIGVIGAAVSLGFFIKLYNDVSDKNKEISGYREQKANLLKDQARIQEMVNNVGVVVASINEISRHNSRLHQIWVAIENQVQEVTTSLTLAQNISSITRARTQYKNRIEPMFVKLAGVMKAYGENC